MFPFDYVIITHNSGPETTFRHSLGERQLLIPGSGQHLMDDDGRNIHVKPGDIITVETFPDDALETIPWFIMKRVIYILTVDWCI